MARKERERRYISEYMLDTWPAGGWRLNVQLGPIPQDLIDRHGPIQAARIFQPTRPRVDAVMPTDDAYYLIEAKVRDVKNGIGDLTFYRGLASKTLDLPGYTGQPIVARLVIPWMIEWMQDAADANQVDVRVFERDWIADYVKERQNYFTAEYRQERAERLELRRILGVE